MFGLPVGQSVASGFRPPVSSLFQREPGGKCRAFLCSQYDKTGDKLKARMAVSGTPAGVRQNQKEAIYFVTFTCYKWKPLFEKVQIYDNLYKWFILDAEKCLAFSIRVSEKEDSG